MPRDHDSGQIDLSEVFRRVQREMVAQLSVGQLFEHASSHGAATERHWLELFERYLPQRYRAAPAFVIDSSGRRSRQIDLAISDNLSSPLLFPHSSGFHISAESVYAVFEVKQTLCAKWIADAGHKAASVRRLRRTSMPLLSAGSLYPPKPPFPILAGILSLDAVWAGPFPDRVSTLLRRMPSEEHLDLGCSLRQGAFEVTTPFSVHFSAPQEALIYFVLRLLHRLQQVGAAPAIDLSQYASHLR